MEGFDAKFDPPLDKRLECPICLLAQREPMQTPCGHRFCSTCILRALRETGPRCPVDNTRVCNHQLFKDNFAKREVLSLNVKCSAEECGCPWHGELRNLEGHTGICELVHIDCPNSCGHSCQRKHLSPHLVLCMNKPEQCQHCSIHFCRNRMEEHRPNCSAIMVPESILSNLMKANEVLKWCGNIKLKVNVACSKVFQQAAGSMFQVSGYLTAKVDSQESFLFTGSWTNCCSVMPLNAPSAKIFWRTLHGREVQSKTFGFGLLATDTKSNLFSRILKRKLVDVSAVLGLRLKSGRNRNDLTIIYFYWCESKKRLMACVAELKSHLVKQLQNRLHILHNPQRGRGLPSESHISRSHSRFQSRGGESRTQGRMGDRPHHQSHQQFPVPPHPAPATYHAPPAVAPPLPSHPSAGHILHPHLHAAAAAHPAVALLTPAGPGAQPHPHHLQATQSHPHLHPDSTQLPPMGHPRFLSWQMSRSLNGYPWRVQTGSVPYFSFPSTPPSFLPSNPLPYTFAPVPPFSISQIAQVPSSGVPVPSYAGIAVQGTVVDSMVPGPNGAPFPVAAIPSLSDVPTDHLHHSVPPGAVAVTITSAGAVPGQAGPTVVIQQSVMPSHDAVQSQDMAVLHAIGATPPHYQVPPMPAHMGPAIIAADGAPGQGLMGPSVPPGEGVARYHVTPHLVSMAPPPSHHNLVGVSLDYAGESSQGHSSRTLGREQERPRGGVATSHFTGSEAGRGRGHAMLNDGAGPSGIVDSDSASDNDSIASDSPSRNFASLIYGMNRYSNYDSDDSSDAPVELDSSDSMLHVGDMSADSQLSSDGDDSSPSSVSDTQSPTDPSTVRHISRNTATVVISPAPSPSSAPSSSLNLSLNTTFYTSSDEGSPIATTSADESGTLTLPVLINITESDSTHVTPPRPTSVIDLTTNSPTPTTSQGGPDGNPPLSSRPSSSNAMGGRVTAQRAVATNTYDDVITVSPTYVSMSEQQGLEQEVFMPTQQQGQASLHSNAGHYSGRVLVPRGRVRPREEEEFVAGQYNSIPHQFQQHDDREDPLSGEDEVQLVTAGRYAGPRLVGQGSQSAEGHGSQSTAGDPIPVVSMQGREEVEAQRSSRQFGGPIPVVRGQPRREDRTEGHDLQLVNHSHSMVHIHQQPHSHNPQLYTQGHAHLLQPGSLHGYHDVAQQTFPSYSSHLAPGGAEMQQVPPPVAASVLPMESSTGAMGGVGGVAIGGAGAMAMGGAGGMAMGGAGGMAMGGAGGMAMGGAGGVAMGSNVRVLRWQPALNQQHHHPGAPVPLPPSGFPSHQGVESVPNQAQPGNFWETVMPSLDMSLQGAVSTESLQ